jgi:pimeloyl-ACP methyl ester carboxylesterase
MDFTQRVIRPAMEACASGDVRGAFDRFMTGVCGADHGKILEQRLGSAGYQQAIRESAFFFADELRALWEWSFGAAEAGRISQPTLVIEGGESHLLGPMHEIVEMLTRLLPNAETAQIAGVNHMMPLQDPDAVGRAIAANVRRHLTESSPALTPT